MPWNNGLTQLQYELADLYFRPEQIRMVAVQAGIPERVLDLDGAPIVSWHNILREAANREKVETLVAIALDEFPKRKERFDHMLALHHEGTGAWAAALAELNHMLSKNFREVLLGVVVAILVAWITAGAESFIFRYEFVILLLFLIILLTPFVLRAGLTLARIPVRRVTLVILSTLLMAGEAALFSMVIGGSVQAERTEPEIDARAYLSQDLKRSQCDDEGCQTHVWVRGEPEDARAWIQSSDWESDRVFIQLLVEWSKKEKMSGLERNYNGFMLFTSQYKCQSPKDNGTGPLLLRGLELEESAFRPGRIVLSWLIGFAEIPYLDDPDVTGKVKSILKKHVDLCSATNEMSYGSKR
ncbi:MAG: effector-associated domain EAD1-containing protein [Chloroflexota bacterium]